MASVRSIAEKAGVSIATVSRVLNDDPAVTPRTRDAVMQVIDRSGYSVRVRKVAGATLGFAYTQKRTLAVPYDAAVFEGVVRGAEESRWDVMLVSFQRDKRRDESFTQFFQRKGVRAVVLRTAAATRDVCQQIADEGFPHVVISERFDSPDVNYIDGDSKGETHRAIDYLISLGHRRIAFGMHNVPDRDHFDRFEAYQAALAEHGIAYDGKLVCRHPATLAGGGTILTLLVNRPERPTAVFFADPILAIGAMRRAQELSLRVPADMSIVGFDDTDARFSTCPVLTAVCQDASMLGVEAARWLTRGAWRMPFRKTIPTYFEINGSVGPGPHLAPNGAHAAAAFGGYAAQSQAD